MKDMLFVIFHGSFGSPEGNWFLYLKEKLESIGQKVLLPRFPIDGWDELTKLSKNMAKAKNQTLRNWTKVFESNILPEIKKYQKIVFVAHSLGPLFVLHMVDKLNIKLDSAIFVSPFLQKLNCDWQINLVNNSFYRTDFDFAKLKKLIPISYVLYSNTDPYVDVKFSLEFAKKLNSSTIFVKNAGHMNSEVNLNEFPLVYELCKAIIGYN